MRQSLFALLLTLASGLSAQPDVSEVRIRSAEDAAEHNSKARQSAQWVLESAEAIASEEWDEISLFILNWSRFTTEYPIRMRTELTQFMKANPSLTTVYLAGWIQFAMSYPDQADSESACTTAALEACAQFYGRNSASMKRNEAMLSIVRKDMEGSLGAWVASELNRLNQAADN